MAEQGFYVRTWVDIRLKSGPVETGQPDRRRPQACQKEEAVKEAEKEKALP